MIRKIEKAKEKFAKFLKKATTKSEIIMASVYAMEWEEKYVKRPLTDEEQDLLWEAFDVQALVDKAPGIIDDDILQDTTTYTLA